MNNEKIIIRGARENNLKNLSLELPKHQITVFTGVSGSGKSSLVLDTIAAKSRRELNDTFPTFVQQYLPKYGRPHVDAIENLPIAIVIDQKKPAQNSRSTVGTYTDIAALLRLLFSRVGEPFVGYSDTFSFNHPEGSCPRCSGLGEIRELDIHKLVDFDKSLNDEDTIHYIAFGKGGWRWIRYAHSGLFDLDKKIRDYSPEELDLFLNSPQIRLKNPPSNWPKTAKYEGLIPRMYRSIINSEEGLLHAAVLNPMLRMGTCPDCGGTRLNPKVLTCKVRGTRKTGADGHEEPCELNIAEACALSIHRLNAWIKSIASPLAVDLKAAISARLTALEEIGLGYLSLDRAVGTLSGGEAQRCKIAKYINSSLSDVLYILDEPSTGLHNRDIELMKHSVCRLRDAGNTVLLVEHHPEMIRIADHIVDMGPGPGIDGGRIVFQGSYPELLRSNTDTGRALAGKAPLSPPDRAPLSPPDRAPLSPPEGGTTDSALKTIEAPSGAVGGASEASCVTTLSDKEYWVTMSDGTLVHLNYNTRVIYPEKFVGDSRDVYLDGEAYFMVAKDKRHPFIVHTPQGDIRVHGTEFNVSTRGGESGKWKEESGKWKEERGKWKEAYCTEVVLVKGSVGVTPTSGSEQMMRPGQKCSILNSQFSIDEVDVEPYVAWNTGTFVFEDCPLSQLMDVLSKWYGFKVVFQSTEAWEKHFTGEIDRYGSIRPTLEAISQVTGLSLYVRDGKIVIE